MQFDSLTSLYHYFDQLSLAEGNDDDLFASSYIRGFIALVASNYGDESQVLSKALADEVSEKLTAAKSELTPQDQQIVKQYWLSLKSAFNG